MAVYDEIPVPHFGVGDTYQDEELLYSTARFTQKGITIAGGQGEILIGTVMARSDTDKKYYPYAAGALDGLGVARGVLRHSVDMGAPGARDQLQNLVISGILKLSMVKGADAGALAQLGAVTDDVRDTFKF